MKKKVIVLSLGGSLIVPDEIDYIYLRKFKEVLKKHSKKYKFVIVCGGGKTARRYIKGISHVTKDLHLIGLAGISVTRMNARYMSYFFGYEQEYGSPESIKQLDSMLKNKDIVFCGALSYKTGSTTDTQAAEIAKQYNSSLVNLTDVDGLFAKDPKKFKDAKLISQISWREFHKIACAIKFHPGQHFVLDQNASELIMKNKIKVIILGKDLNQLDNYLRSKNFKGTVIEG